VTTTEAQPEDLRARMVARIADAGYLASADVERALRTVARHLFVPEVSPEEAYADKAITTKPGGPGGRPASCASEPTVVAMMLGQLDVQPGMRVLEIGAGTGYNAALLAELAGDTGQVTTIDIHPDVTERARHTLDAAGYDRVRVITGDGTFGVGEHAPYDRIIVTVGPWDLPPAWADQLTPRGRLVVPLHWRGQARSVAFVHQDNGVLRATNSQLCGFIPMIGDGQDGEHTTQIAENVALYWDRDQFIYPPAVRGVLDRPSTTVWSGASVVANESTDGIWLRLTGTEPGTCRFAADPAAVEAGRCKPAFKYRNPALVEDSSLAYLTLHGPEPEATERRWELGAIGHGPTGANLAGRLCDQIREWDHDRTAQPVITAYPADTPDEELGDGLLIDKQFVRLVISGC
jgi:protein-L-isoaspartate(D-aspartate) O-methyltransferase